MSLRIGDIAPNFTADSSKGTINFYDYLGDNWGLIFSHPADYTPVCTTELGATAALNSEFEKRHVKVIALSVDSAESHLKWISDINETQGVIVDFPIIADENKKVAELYDMIHPNASATATVRSVFVIAPDKTVKMTMTYPMSAGRNFMEILRVIDSLQLSAQYSVATPANWKNGDDVIISLAVKDEDAATKFPGYKTIKPYLRTTAQPK
ncbi:MAG: peroxiredoxin [bacterium]|nr:peroxiredoxin [bacterium]